VLTFIGVTMYFKTYTNDKTLDICVEFSIEMDSVFRWKNIAKVCNGFCKLLEVFRAFILSDFILHVREALKSN